MFATREFIVAAGRTEDGDIREIDLEMEIGAISDTAKVRKVNSVKISKEIKQIELDSAVHVTVKLGTVEEMYYRYVRERHGTGTAVGAAELLASKWQSGPRSLYKKK